MVKLFLGRCAFCLYRLDGVLGRAANGTGLSVRECFGKNACLLVKIQPEQSLMLCILFIIGLSQILIFFLLTLELFLETV